MFALYINLQIIAQTTMEMTYGTKKMDRSAERAGIFIFNPTASSSPKSTWKNTTGKVYLQLTSRLFQKSLSANSFAYCEKPDSVTWLIVPPGTFSERLRYRL